MTSLNLNVIITYQNSSTDSRKGVLSSYSDSTFDEILRSAKSSWELPCYSDIYDVQLREHDDSEDHMTVEAQSQICTWLNFFCSRGPIVEFLLDKVDSNKKDNISNTTEHKTDEFELLFAGNLLSVTNGENVNSDVDAFFQDVLGSNDSSKIEYNDETQGKKESIPFSNSNKLKGLLTPLLPPPGILISELNNTPSIQEEKYSPMKDANIVVSSVYDNSSFVVPMSTNDQDEFINKDPSIVSVLIKSRKDKCSNYVNGNHNIIRNSDNTSIKSNIIEDIEKEFSEQEELSGDESDGHLTSNQNLTPRLTALIEPDKSSLKVNESQPFDTELEKFKVHIRNNGGIISLSKNHYLTKEWPELARLLKKRFSKVHGMNTMTKLFLENKCLGIKVLPASESKPLRYCLSETDNLDMKVTSESSRINDNLDERQSALLQAELVEREANIKKDCKEHKDVQITFDEESGDRRTGAALIASVHKGGKKRKGEDEDVDTEEVAIFRREEKALVDRERRRLGKKAAAARKGVDLGQSVQFVTAQRSQQGPGASRGGQDEEEEIRPMPQRKKKALARERASAARGVDLGQSVQQQTVNLDGGYRGMQGARPVDLGGHRQFLGICNKHMAGLLNVQTAGGGVERCKKSSDECRFSHQNLCDTDFDDATRSMSTKKYISKEESTSNYDLRRKINAKLLPNKALFMQSTSNLPSCASISDPHTNLIANSLDSSTISVETFNPTPVVMSRDRSKEDVMSSKLVQNYADDAIIISNPIDNKGVIIDNINIDTICDDGVKSSSASKTKNEDSNDDIIGHTKRIRNQDIYTHPKTGLQYYRKWESDSLNIPFNPSATEQPADNTSHSKDQILRDKIKSDNSNDDINGHTTRIPKQDIYTHPKTGLQRNRKWESESLNIPFNSSPTKQPADKTLHNDQRLRDSVRDVLCKGTGKSSGKDSDYDVHGAYIVKKRDRDDVIGNRNRSRETISSRNRDRDRRPRSRR